MPAKTPAKPAPKKAPVKKAPTAPPAAARTGRPKYLPRGSIWCGKCLALASAEGSITTKSGFAFCKDHK